MFGSDILDVAIGMVLVFLSMSLIMTAVQESIAGFLKTRAVSLERSILQLLQGNQELVRQFYDHPLVSALFEGSHPGGVAGARWRGRKLPSYIPREIFSAAILDMERQDKADPMLTQAMARVRGLVGGDVNAQRRHLEQWYDGAMDRASGWYKRHTQKSLFTVTLVAAIALNINSISIFQFLMVNPQQRDLATALAQKAPPPATATGAEVRAFTTQIQGLGLPLGWSGAGLEWTNRQLPAPGSSAFARALAWLLLAVGYLITAFSVMMGAPFWFDTLNRIMVIRATVKPKEKSPDEPSEEGGVPQPPPPPLPQPAPVAPTT
jgi:hypothetical protein